VAHREKLGIPGGGSAGPRRHFLSSRCLSWSREYKRRCRARPWLPGWPGWRSRHRRVRSRALPRRVSLTIDQRHQGVIVGFGLGDALGHDEVILADRNLRRVAQLKLAVVSAHEAGLGIGLGQPGFRRSPARAAVALAPVPFARGPRACPALDRGSSSRCCCHSATLRSKSASRSTPPARRVRLQARRIDGHRAHPRQSRGP